MHGSEEAKCLSLTVTTTKVRSLTPNKILSNNNKIKEEVMLLNMH